MLYRRLGDLISIPLLMRQSPLSVQARYQTTLSYIYRSKLRKTTLCLIQTTIMSFFAYCQLETSATLSQNSGRTLYKLSISSIATLIYQALIVLLRPMLSSRQLLKTLVTLASTARNVKQSKRSLRTKRQNLSSFKLRLLSIRLNDRQLTSQDLC